MQKLLIKLTPLESYFFGGERIFEFDGKNQQYFIRSLNTPSQTALFGALRYIGIQNPSKDFRLSDIDKANIGAGSYNLMQVNEDGYGKIKKISPLYIMNHEGDFLIRTPLDHRINDREKTNSPLDSVLKVNKTYTRFEQYSDKIRTNKGYRSLPLDYTAKDGITDSWVLLSAIKSERIIYTDLFEGAVQIGIAKRKQNNSQENSYFKKEYIKLKKGFSFAFFADVEDGFVPYNHIVYLGQGKSSFRADWQVIEQNSEIIRKVAFPSDFIRSGMIYAQSDIYYPQDINKLYAYCQFVCVKTRDYRVFTTNYETAQLKIKSVRKRYEKYQNSKLIQAGSMFYPYPDINFMDIFSNEEISDNRFNEHAQIAGLNNVIIGG